MAVSLPSPGANGSGDYAAISRTFIKHAREELQKGNNLQASEKIWGAAAHAAKAVAVQRGWRHGRHDLLFAVTEQLGAEFHRPELNNGISIAESYHVYFYENQRGEEAVRSAIDAIEQFVTSMEELRLSPPRPFTIETTAEQNRLRRLLGRSVAIGAHSDVGFARPRRGNRQG